MFKKVPCGECGGHGFISGFNYDASGECMGIYGKQCPTCGGSGEVDEVVTNWDVIKSYSKEELVEWYCGGRDCGRCDFGKNITGCHILRWLSEPAEDREGVIFGKGYSQLSVL